MYCSKCGWQLSDNSSFCSHCGSAVHHIQQQSTPAAQPPSQASAPQPQRQQPAQPQPNYNSQQQQSYSPAGQASVYRQGLTTPVPPPTQAPIPAEKRIYTASTAHPAQAAPQSSIQAPPHAPGQVPPMPARQVVPTPSAPAPTSPAPTAPSSPPGTPAADIAQLNNALHAGISVVPKRNKTKTDMICGVVFLLLGIVALGIYGFSAATLIVDGGLAGMFPVLQSFTEVGFLTSLLSLGNIFALVAGVLMTLGGIFALTSGRGRKPAYTAIVLMLFTLAFDAVYLLLMNQWGYLSITIGEAIARSFVIYAFEITFVLVPTILLVLKKRAKKRAHTTLVLQTDDIKRKDKKHLVPPVQSEPVIPVPKEDPAGMAEKTRAEKPAAPVGMDVPLPSPVTTKPEESPAVSKNNRPE